MKSATSHTNRPIERSKLLVVYIAGYSRSGSTILDIMLGSIPGVLSGGEMTYLFEDACNPARHCACGRVYANCPVWGPVLSSMPDTGYAAELTRRMEGNWLLPQGGRGMGGFNSARKQEYRQLLNNVMNHVSDQGYRVLVDSSKSAGDAANRVRFLLETDVDLKVIHLYRSFFDTIRSVGLGSNWDLEGHGPKRGRVSRILRACVGFMMAQVSARKMKHIVSKDHYLFVNYANLRSESEKTIAEIGSFLDLDTASINRKILRREPFTPGHNVGGNRLRLKNEIIFDTD